MKKIENKIKKIFDYQRFENNKDLQNVINETEDRAFCNCKSLNDEKLLAIVGGKKANTKSSAFIKENFKNED